MLNIDNNLYKLVLEQMGCISIVDTEYRYIYVNESWINSFNTTREEVIGRYIEDIMSYTKIDIALRTGTIKVSININNNAKKNIIYNVYSPLVEDNVIVGGLIYTEFRDMNANYDYKKIMSYDNLKLKDKQDILIKETLMDALEKSKGNKANAAKLLGISRTVIYDKLKKYDLM